MPTGIERKNYLAQASSFLKSNVILAVIGIRRGGKSFLMWQIAKDLTYQKIKEAIRAFIRSGGRKRSGKRA